MMKTLIPKEYKLEIKEIIDEAPDVKTFRMKIPDNSDLDYYPGQFFMVSMDDDPKLQRAYSISSSPSNKEFIDITLNQVGIFTKKIFKCNIGNSLNFKGPFGKFFFQEEIKNNIILIGGGLGITSLMSIIRYCNDKSLDNKIKLIFSAKTPAEIIYYKEIMKIMDENKNFNSIITITRPEPEHNWGGRTGRINSDLLKENILDLNSDLFYLCGSKEFVKANIAILESFGARKEQFKTDIWG